jgi:hypothetical protein
VLIFSEKWHVINTRGSANCNKVYKMSHMSLVLFHRINVLRLAPLIWTVHCVSFHPLLYSMFKIPELNLLLDKTAFAWRIHAFRWGPLSSQVCCSRHTYGSVFLMSQLVLLLILLNLTVISFTVMNYPRTCWYIAHVQTRCVSRLISNFLKAATK